MPTYAYKCDVCKEVFEIRHGMFFQQERCVKCNSVDCLERMPSALGTKVSSRTVTRPRSGEVVKKYIEDTREVLDTEKKQLKKQEYIEK